MYEIRSVNLGQPITGPQFATLLEILVTAANEGSLAEVCKFDCIMQNVYVHTVPTYIYMYMYIL